MKELNDLTHREQVLDDLCYDLTNMPLDEFAEYIRSHTKIDENGERVIWVDVADLN